MLSSNQESIYESSEWTPKSDRQRHGDNLPALQLDVPVAK
jgi:hypothetical protein